MVKYGGKTYDLIILDDMSSYDAAFFATRFLRDTWYYEPPPVLQDVAKQAKMQYGPQKNTRKGKGKKYV